MTFTRSRIAVAVAVGSVAGLTACAPGGGTQPSTADIVVTDPAGAPIAGATVSVADATGRVVVRFADADGRAELPTAPVGITTTVDAPGRLAVTRAGAGGTYVLAPDPLDTDTDADGLSDGEEAAASTDPTGADTDADGIDDTDEVIVRGPFSARALDASPLRRDLFLELDWRSDLTPDISFVATSTLQGIFEDSPIVNPDGSRGIRLHLDWGQAGGGTPVTIDPATYDCPDFDQSIPNLAPERANIWFHAFISPRPCGAGGWAYARRSVILGLPASNPVGQIVWASSVAHELGHTLGLQHGGADEFNCKPNYPSVMNYDALPMLMKSGLRFSRGDEVPIDENAVRENVPFLGRNGYDFDQDGTIESEPYARNLNNGSWPEPLFGSVLATLLQRSSATYCETDGLSVLTDHDDWTEIERNLPVAVGTPIGAGGWDPEFGLVGVSR